MLPLTLAVDGTDWAAQFATWGAVDWVVLALTASVVCCGANWCIQHATWRVGAPVLSMFYVSGRWGAGDVCLVAAGWPRAVPLPLQGMRLNPLMSSPRFASALLPQGLRLVAAIVESKLILGATVITTGLQVGAGACAEGCTVHCTLSAACAACIDQRPCKAPLRLCLLPPHSLQIAGVVVTVSAVTFYMVYTWWASQQQQAPAQAAAPAAGGESAPRSLHQQEEEPPA